MLDKSKISTKILPFTKNLSPFVNGDSKHLFCHKSVMIK